MGQNITIKRLRNSDPLTMLMKLLMMILTLVGFGSIFTTGIEVQIT